MPLHSMTHGEHAERLAFSIQKARTLRYGTNPSQHAALYGASTFLTTLKELKTGKQGPSQTNMEDIAYAALISGYFNEPSAIIMKHENPSGFAVSYYTEPLSRTYAKARDADFRAAFGGTVLLTREVDRETAGKVQELFTEVLVAPGFDEGVVESFKGSIRIFEYDCEQFSRIPRYSEDSDAREVKTLPDGSLIESAPLLSPIRTIDDLRAYVVSERQPTRQELRDLLMGYRIRLRSNSVRFVKDGYTTGLGTGQQDRIMCIDIAAYKNRKLSELAEKENRARIVDYSIDGSVLVSDGFFPFTDSVDLAHELGITALLAPHGGQRFLDVRARADIWNMAFVDIPEDARFFSHH